MNILDYVTDEEINKHINPTIIDGNMMSMSLIIMERKYGYIDTDDYSCHSYYIIKFSSSSYNLQADLMNYGRVISSGELYVRKLIYLQSTSIIVITIYK